MLRIAAAFALSAAMFATGAEAAAYRITANGITFSNEGAFAPGGAHEVPIGSSVSIDVIVGAINPTYDAVSGEYYGGSSGPGGSGIATFGGGVVLDVTAPVSWSDILDNASIVPTVSADLGGLVAPGTYDLIGFGTSIDVAPGQILQASLILFLPVDSFETWTSLADIPFGAVPALIGFDHVDRSSGVSDVAYASASAVSIAPVPLPAAAPLLIAGLAGIGAMRRLRR